MFPFLKDYGLTLVEDRKQPRVEEVRKILAQRDIAGV